MFRMWPIMVGNHLSLDNVLADDCYNQPLVGYVS